MHSDTLRKKFVGIASRLVLIASVVMAVIFGKKSFNKKLGRNISRGMFATSG